MNRPERRMVRCQAYSVVSGSWSWRRGPMCRPPASRWQIGAPTSSKWKVSPAATRKIARHRGFTRQAARADTDFILELSNRGKRSIALDLKTDTGREIFGQLLAQADVLLTNWLPAALERVRLTVEDIRRFNPNIIIARGTGLGVRGPDRDRGGFDAATYLARGGVAYTLTPFGTEHPAVQGRPSVTCRRESRWPAASAAHCSTGNGPASRRLWTHRCWPGHVEHRALDFGRRPFRCRRNTRCGSGVGH
ncbi:coA-transferase III family protein [Mycobacterium xenopi 3993]|nr:coA-transferase III family protein [Mycobacterium xenopi 3993]